MNPLWPTAAEAASLRFLVPLPDLRTRVLAAATLFILGSLLWCSAPLWLGIAGLVLILLGHLPLWVYTQTTAPGGATPAHEDVWAPVEDDWLTRLRELERKGKRWDTTPWDISNAFGCLTLFVGLAALAATALLAVSLADTDAPFVFGPPALLMLAPLWLNGMRTTWNPSELRQKGEALAVAREDAERLSRGDFDIVPTLALREGRRGKYPVDARLMLRPSRDDGTGFLGVQIQVALNNVQGTDYPYLYAVILGKDAFRLPASGSRPLFHGVDLVIEPGSGEGVRFLVVRQYADEKGGWHTKPGEISTIVAVALERARACWRESGGTPS